MRNSVQLAGRFHVRRETIYRDIRALEELGFPICGDVHGIKSRPNLPPDFSTQAISIPFSPSELLAIAFAASATDHLIGTPLGDDLQSALEKVRSRLPGPVQDRFALTTPLFGPYRKGAKSYRAHKATIATLCQAMLDRHRCQVEYQSPQRPSPSHFTLDPYRMFKFQGGLYVFAYVPVHDAVITLAVERIQQLTATNDPFTVIEGFSFEAMRDQAFGVTAETPMTVVIRFSSAVAPLAPDPTAHRTAQRQSDASLPSRGHPRDHPLGAELGPRRHGASAEGAPATDRRAIAGGRPPLPLILWRYYGEHERDCTLAQHLQVIIQ